MINDNGNPLVRFPAVCCTQQQLEEKVIGGDDDMSVYGVTSSKIMLFESGTKSTASSMGKERRMRVLHEAIEVVIGPLQNCVLWERFGEDQEVS